MKGVPFTQERLEQALKFLKTKLKLGKLPKQFSYYPALQVADNVGMEMVTLDLQDIKKIEDALKRFKGKLAHDGDFDEEIMETQKMTKKQWKHIKKFNKHITDNGDKFVMSYDDRIGTFLEPVEIIDEAFKLGKKNQYTIDDVNVAYGFWGTLELGGFKRREIEDCMHSAMAWLTENYRFSDAGALYYLNAKAGRWIADQVIEQKGNKDVVDVLEDYATDAEWKKWSKEYNKFAQEEMMSEATDSKIYEEALLENAVRDLHFEADPKKAEDMKIAIGTSQGEVTRRKQIEGGEYSLRRFRKEIKYGDGKDLGVFLPGSYDAATSTLGDGPHKKAVKKVRWNRKKYDQWIEDVASNDGWKNAFDMAQNAKHEPGLLQWAKKEFRGEDVMQRIQWDIEAFAESLVTEKKLDRDAMIKWIEKYMDFVRTTEEFNGSQGGIWVSGENMDEYKGRVIYDYYSEDYKNRTFGVDNKWEKELNKKGWYSEWHDAGTSMIWPL